MKSLKLRSNLGKIYIQKLPSYLILAILGSIFSRLVFLLISILFDIVPYMCYDDLYVYGIVEELSAARISNILSFRNIYILLSLYLNPYHIGEYISAARLLNVFVLVLIILKVDQISVFLEVDQKTRKKLSLLFAFSPYFMIYSLVQLREVLCAYFVLYLFWAFFIFEKGEKVPYVRVIVIAVLLYFTRTYILEVLAILVIAYKSKHSKWYVKFFLGLVAIFAIWYFFNDADYMYVLNNKIDVYVTQDNAGTGMLSQLQVTGLKDIYKILFLVPFVQVSPLPSAYQVEYYDANSWAALITYFSGIAAFFLPYFWINTFIVLFSKKKNGYEKIVLLFYLIFVVLIAVTEPHNSRYMFFSSPIFYLFGVDGFIKLKRQNPRNILLGVACMFVPYIYLLI